jgi:aminopeptidase N
VTNRSLTRDEAVRRAALLDVASYDVALAISDDATFTSRSIVRFTCSEPGSSTFVELADAHAWTATLNGADIPQDRRKGNRIRLDDLLADNELVVEATLPCVTSGDGMHRYVDPADGATYLTAFCGSDLAQRVFACFDQPDLKATVTLSVAAPEDWTVLGNGRPTTTDDGVRHFATTPPISTYLFVVSAGPWHSVAWEHAGLPFAWHARRSLADALDREAAHLREVTEACFDHYTDLFDEPYPFDSYDQVFAPGLNWGALETPGCVTFRDEMLAPDGGSHTDNQLRAMVIAHEMAHMWFGDLVTLRWWEDIWLNESFADYMGFEVAQTAAGFEATWAWFTLSREHTGYAADERRSTHPVAQPPELVVDTDTGFANTDMITYSKGNAVLRQLVTWLGPDTFAAGVNRYLSAHRFGNADLADFLAALDGVSDRDVRGWADVWLRTTGFDTLAVRTDDGGSPVLHREGSRPHRTQVTAYDVLDGRLVAAGQDQVDVAADPVRLAARDGQVVLPNSSDETFARVRPDPESWSALLAGVGTIADPQARAVVWTTGFDLVGHAALAPSSLVAAALEQLPGEALPSIWAAVVERLLEVTLPRHVEPADVPATREALTRLADRTTSPDLALPARRLMVACTADVPRLSAMLEGDPDPDLFWRILVRLAELGAVDADRIERFEARRPSSQARTGAARALAALPTTEAKERAWDVFSADDVDNRVFHAVGLGLWTPEQADLSAPYVERYLDQAPVWAARRGQGFSRTIGGVFPLHAVSEATRERLRTALDGDVPTVLRRAWNDRLDDLDLDLLVRRARRTSR